jgi:hypothetical protein
VGARTKNAVWSSCNTLESGYAASRSFARIGCITLIIKYPEEENQSCTSAMNYNSTAKDAGLPQKY